MRGDEAAPGLEHASQQRSGHRERRVRHHRVGPARQPQIARVGPYDRHCVPEAVAERLCATRVQLDGDDARATVDERRGQRTEAGTDVEHEIAAPHTGFGDESFSPIGSEQVGTPPWRGHGDAPS